MNKFLITLTACLPLALGFATAQRSPAPAPAGLSIKYSLLSRLPTNVTTRQVGPQLPGEPQLIPNHPPDVSGCVWYYYYGWRLACEASLDPASDL